MKHIISLFVLLASISCLSQDVSTKNDTLRTIQKVTLLINNNGFTFSHFFVSGDIYLTNNLVIFCPKPFRRKRFEMHNDLVKYIRLSYDSITAATGNYFYRALKIKTKTKKYKIVIKNGKTRRATVKLINQLKEEHIAK